MDAMDICIATTKEISHLIVNHPIYSTFGSLVILASLLKFYCRLTLGVCESDQDMAGKTVLITGATAGIGKATARELARRNARVLLACRNVAKAERVAEEIKKETGNQNVVVKCLDLCSFASVKECAEDVLRTEQRLDVLINNAGITSLGTAPSSEVTEDGYETVMQSNHLGHFLLTLLLIDLLKRSAPSRIINVSSFGKNYAKFDVEKDLTNKKSSLNTYGNSKLANVLFTREMAQRLSETGVTVNALCPGCVHTDIFGDKLFSNVLMFCTKIIYFLVAKTAEEGAQTSIYLAVHPELEKTTGRFFSDCKEEKLRKQETDKALAKRVFEISENIVGVSFTGK